MAAKEIQGQVVLWYQTNEPGITWIFYNLLDYEQLVAECIQMLDRIKILKREEK